MNKTDDLYLADILEAIQNIEKFTHDFSFEQFREEDMCYFAVIHMFEIIGEAANKLSGQFIENNADFPVRQAVEMRNMLIHGYDQVKLERVWDTIEKDLPILKKQVEELLS